VFAANTDASSQVRNEFDPPILAKHIRIYPHSWENHISLRFELFGCSLEQYMASIDMRVTRDRPSIMGN